MATFRVLRLDLDPDERWVVETTHDNGDIETSIVYRCRADALKAADGWTYLDEDWARV